jgi:hypothetical protein
MHFLKNAMLITLIVASGPGDFNPYKTSSPEGSTMRSLPAGNGESTLSNIDWYKRLSIKWASSEVYETSE